MLKRGKRLNAALALSLACGAVGLSIGCDDSRSADKRVRQAIYEARLARLKDGGLEQAQSRPLTVGHPVQAESPGGDVERTR